MKYIILLIFILIASHDIKANEMIDSLKTHIANKDLDKVISLIETHPEVLDATDENNTSGLLIIAYSGMEAALDKAAKVKTSFTFHEAIVCGKIDEVKNALSKKKNLANKYSNDGFSPLSLAAFFNQNEVASVLLEYEADPNLQATNPSKVNALHSAVARENYELCKQLIAHGADANLAQMQNVTPLHSAAHRGNLKLVQLLVNNGADIHSKMDNGDTALSIAERDGHSEVKDYLESL
ncbi:ankyrin repeat domain-containing protein [Fulvivirga lutimaris]|uniref:ankyrin repeat domain-containing protein n=1 Tax=Fulvivirga lutimaris TaxID=1819566 RepID=UPI0012BBC683|nr:ankyrin repeat domain-containing protein [Fulvivirga lutimaris]MTI38063.1 ankyrin repeat domain-containing protein [Fulvivirga lutimaris]